MRPRFIGAIGLIARTLEEGRSVYVRTLGLPLRRAARADFLFSTKLGGGRYFGVWPLAAAARTCFGSNRWPANRPVPQMFIEFEMARAADVAAAARELEVAGHRLLHPPRTDPWGQTVARLQTRDGVIVGVSFVPWMHRKTSRRSVRAAAPNALRGGGPSRRRRTPRARPKV